jgi:hypothetical protein
MHANQGDHLIVDGKKIGTQSREGEMSRYEVKTARHPTWCDGPTATKG